MSPLEHLRAWRFALSLITRSGLLLLLSALRPAVADSDTSTPDLRIGWLVFGDLYHVPSFHNATGDDATGLVMRRAYLTFDSDLSEQWFGRLRFEANQSGEFEEYDVDTDVKDLYLGRKLGDHRLLLGLAPTPTFDLIESLWGLRYLARTPMDLQGVPSRDTGIALRGPLTADRKFSYRTMLGSSSDIGAGGGDGNKAMAAVSWQPDARWTVDLYADYEGLPGPADRRTLQGFVAFNTDTFRWGLQYANQDRQDDAPLELVSGYFVARAGADSSVVVRVDRLLEPSPKGDDIAYLPFDPTARATMLIAGFEFRRSAHYYLTPNVVIKKYDRNDAGVRPKSDVQLRLTLFLDFE